MSDLVPDGPAGPPRFAARVILLDPDGRVLLVRASDKVERDVFWWELPGGGVDRGETAQQAAMREVVEETGYTSVALGPKIGELRQEWAFSDVVVDQHDSVFVAFLTGDDRVAQQLEPGEVAVPRWLTVDEVAALTEPIVPANLAELVTWIVGPEDVDKPGLDVPENWPYARGDQPYRVRESHRPVQGSDGGTRTRSGEDADQPSA